MGAEQESIGGLFARLADDAGALIRAEVEVYRAAALHRLALSQRALIYIASAALLALAALICLLIMLAISLATLIGPLGGGFVVTIVTLAIAALLARIGIQQLAKATSEAAEEKTR
jgi:dsDNA-specific endonuclease/ATPase MutS2